MGMTNDYLDALEFRSTYLKLEQEYLEKELINFNFCLFINSLVRIKKSFLLKQYIPLWVNSFLLNVKK